MPMQEWKCHTISDKNLSGIKTNDAYIEHHSAQRSLAQGSNSGAQALAILVRLSTPLQMISFVTIASSCAAGRDMSSSKNNLKTIAQRSQEMGIKNSPKSHPFVHTQKTPIWSKISLSSCVISWILTLVYFNVEHNQRCWGTLLHEKGTKSDIQSTQCILKYYIPKLTEGV